MRPFRRATPLPILPFCDTILAVFPLAWTFGRLGCTVVHDHPGLQTSASMPLSVAYGPGPVQTYGFFELRFGSVPRFDLGLLEMLFALLVSGLFALTWRRRLPVGAYAAALPLVYAPVRFALDYLRLEDAEGGDLRYASLTPAQWACLALFALGLALLLRLRSPAPISNLISTRSICAAARRRRSSPGSPRRPAPARCDDRILPPCARPNQHGNRGGALVSLEASEHVPTVEVGKADVEHDQVRAALDGEREHLPAEARLNDLVPVFQSQAPDRLLQILVALLRAECDAGDP